MLEFDTLNYWAVLVAWLVNIAVGAFWYSPAAFAKHWEKYTGIDILKIPTKQANRIISFVSFSGFIQALTLGIIIASIDATTALQGLSIGLLLWFGLVTATTVGVTLYSKRSWKFLWLNSAYFLVVMSINSMLLAAWK